MKINQRLAAIQEEIIQERKLIISKNSELCGILTWPIPIPLSPAPL